MSWRRIERAIKEAKLDSMLAYAPEDKRIFEASDPDPQIDAYTEVLPTDYLTFVKKVGYPMLLVPHDLSFGFAFLPPPAMAQVSAQMGEPERPWEEVKRERMIGNYKWRYAMFAGWNFSDVSGWCFGVDPDDPEAGPVVWLVEDSVPREIVGTFEEWLIERARQVEAKLAELDEEELAKVRAEEDDYDYRPRDLDQFD
jgi:hypothetical protein